MSGSKRALTWGRLLGLLVLVATVGTGWWMLRRSERSDGEMLKDARREFRLGRRDEARTLVDRVIERSPEHVAARKLAAEWSMGDGEYDRAVELLCELPDAEHPERLTGMLGPGDRMNSLRALSRLSSRLEQRVSQEREHVMANDHLAFILTVSGRRWEARTPLLNLLRRGRFSKRHLVLLGEFQNVLADPVMLESCLDQDVDDPLAQLGLGTVAIAGRHWDDALRRCDAAAASAGTGLVEAHVRGLWVVLERGGSDVVKDYVARRMRLAGSQGREHPQLWEADARLARLLGRDREAMRCLWEALDREPDLQSANYQLSELLVREGREKEAARFRERAERLEDLAQTLGRIEIRLGQGAAWSEDLGLLRRAAEQCESLGRLWEAFGWASEALEHRGVGPWAGQLVARVRQRLAAEGVESGLTVASEKPTRGVDVSNYASLDVHSVRVADAPGPRRGASAQFRFEDVATDAGVTFTYHNSPDRRTPGVRMFEYTGGGVAVLDYDQDGWPDLYFTQGCPWAEAESDGSDGETEYRDRLYRNNGDGTFADVTLEAGLGDRGFSQGVAAGDFDNDGWPDLYVANIGLNRLFHNNGDGTFEDLTGTLGFPTTGWSTGCLVADVDGDGHVDLYDVNYLEGRNLFTTICETQGVKMACHPHEFSAARDRWWRGDGAGGFADATEDLGLDRKHGGKGLGIVAGGFQTAGALSLFVANDSVPNFFFSRTSGSEPDRPLRQHAMRSGVAVDRDGRSQACMGVAAADVDGDGRLDLFVTNYFDEANALYRQVGDLVFTDDTARAGLREPGWRMLGFGTQFLDADLDGAPDLVVANGHVDDLRPLNQPYRMRPQFYRNTGSGQFVELGAAEVGPYFQREMLGRGLARGDLDRDGKDDVVVTHLQEPVAVLLNRTVSVGSAPMSGLTVRLVATGSARDAIGARVIVRSGERIRSHFLTAGDGYMASNQRQLVIGTGGRERVDELTVSWPSGKTTRLKGLPAAGEWVIVEGRGRGYRRPR